jgi:transposase
MRGLVIGLKNNKGGPHGYKSISLNYPLDPDVQELPPLFKGLLIELMEEFKFLKEKIKRLETHLQQLGKEDVIVKRLMTIPGIGPLSGSALGGIYWRYSPV